MDEAVSYTDYFVLLTGANTRQTRAIADEIQHRLRADHRPARVEGEREGEWILIDFIDVVVHVFTTTARDFYRLETLWGDVPRLDVPGRAEAAARRMGARARPAMGRSTMRDPD